MITLTDLLSPLRRQLHWLAASFLIITTLLLLGLYYGLPQTNKTTLYFSIKPVVADGHLNAFDPLESTTKAAEGIAGWAKNPAFRQTILDRSGVEVKNFKRKISARKQDRINVFWTLSLSPGQEPVIEATRNTIEEAFATWNEANAAPYAMTPIQAFTEGRTIPMSWLILFSLTIGSILSVLLCFLREMWGGRLSFQEQIRDIFPESPLLSVPEKLGAHDEKLLEQFILSFESPRLVGTFLAAEKHFSLSPTAAVNQQQDTPILLVQLGNTRQQELANMEAIFGPECGIIMFEK